MKFCDPHAVGVQAIPRTSTDNYLVFAVNTWTRFNNLAAGEFAIYILRRNRRVPATLPGRDSRFLRHRGSGLRT
jgi:hypothetical protein